MSSCTKPAQNEIGCVAAVVVGEYFRHQVGHRIGQQVGSGKGQQDLQKIDLGLVAATSRQQKARLQPSGSAIWFLLHSLRVLVILI